MPSSTAPAPTIHGLALSPQTQCLHYSSPLDIIAIKMACCNAFYACITCHSSLTTHAVELWGKDQRGEKAVLCGICRHVLSIDEYMACGGACTSCGNGFNPGCKAHWGMYWEV
ncbi:zinc finger CHY domain-containing protein [Lepidopterella palustris CBS 459.81]|uniref:Zinc finger CHY domain-containing protein n=1 Tax=Lepidopterella palustris CBS 459.81 TaxID=1314670 RepID=A0A8E2E9E5_9PEZI|nr:zinc finger CHY domain-containing protein [Lepidopterella palustris CBS 459.81]